MAAYLTMTAAHANNAFIATADRIGSERSSGFMGNSLIAATNGWPIGRIAGPDEDTILYADLDIVQARTAPIWNHYTRFFIITSVRASTNIPDGGCASMKPIRR
jgi:predicted amidohydrolase